MDGIKTIIWDWNGTLLDDTIICKSIINNLLEQRNLPKLSLQKYKEIFTFPVKDYYHKAGFDFTQEDFEIPANEFIVSYTDKVKLAKLHQEATKVLEYFKSGNIKQFILSAMEQNSLKKSIEQYGIYHYFQAIYGISDHYAHSKTANAKRLISDYDLNPSEVCLLGDTVHDHEVAELIGCQCILIADGHQTKNRLIATGRIVYDSLGVLKQNF
ncbi:MAG: HAD hydrolase-like protein [Bacteroidetes bacterium]|nr:HAD hydrolase-like protein [Bacteroidota bacterium]